MKAIKSTWKTLNDCLGIVVKFRGYSVYPLLMCGMCGEMLEIRF